MSQAETVSACMPSIGDIFRTYGPAYLKKYSREMPSDQIKAMVAIMRCRTSEAGSVLYRCLDCQKFHQVLQSCGNRNCPVCQGGKAKLWLELQLKRLLPCPYFMLTFTIPAEFRSFMRSHPRECYKALFEATKDTLRRFLQHVLPGGFQKVRHFGFAHPRAKTNWEWLAMLVTVTLNMVYVLTVLAVSPTPKRIIKCPDCGGELTCLGFVPSGPRRLTEFDTS